MGSLLRKKLIYRVCDERSKHLGGASTASSTVALQWTMFTIADVRKQLKVMGFQQHIPDTILQGYITRLRKSHGLSAPTEEEAAEAPAVRPPAAAPQDAVAAEARERPSTRGPRPLGSAPVSAMGSWRRKQKGKENSGPKVAIAFGSERPSEPAQKGVHFSEQVSSSAKVPTLVLPTSKAAATPAAGAKAGVRSRQYRTPPKSARGFTEPTSARRKPLSSRVAGARGSRRVPIRNVGRTPNKCDPVRRYHQFRKAWESDRFLRKSSKFKRS